MNIRIMHVLAVLLALALCTAPMGCRNSADAASEGKSSAGDTAEQSAGETGDDKNDKEPGAEGEDSEEEEEEAVPVEVAELGRGDIEAVLRYSTNLEAESHVQIFSQAARLVTDLLVEEGDHVRRNQILMRLQSDEQRSNLEMVQSELAKARRDYERKQRLFSENLISEQEFNETTYQIEQLELRLADAERELGYTEVRAPITGTITARMVKFGDQIQISQHLFDIVDFDSIVARVYVPEKHFRDLRPGQTARVSAESLGADEYMGSIKRISPVVDPRSGTVKVTIALGGQPGLRPGLYVDVDLVTATHEDTLLIPKRALVYDDDRMYVFRLKNDEEKGERRAERLLIQPVLTNKSFIEPLEGLEPGDQIIIAGQTGLKDGVVVSIPGDEKEEEAAMEEGGIEKASETNQRAGL